MDSPYTKNTGLKLLDDDIPSGIEEDLESFGQVNYSSNATDAVSTEQMRIQWTEELKQVESEINMLRQVLTSKFNRQQHLKRQLGMTAMNELKDDVKQSLDTLRTSEVYQRTSAVVKNVTDKTSTILNEKWIWLKHSDAFKSLENKVGSAYSNVKHLVPFDQLSINRLPIADKQNCAHFTNKTRSFAFVELVKLGKSTSIDTPTNSDPIISDTQLRNIHARPSEPSLSTSMDTKSTNLKTVVDSDSSEDAEFIDAVTNETPIMTEADSGNINRGKKTSSRLVNTKPKNGKHR